MLLLSLAETLLFLAKLLCSPEKPMQRNQKFYERTQKHWLIFLPHHVHRTNLFKVVKFTLKLNFYILNS